MSPQSTSCGDDDTELLRRNRIRRNDRTKSIDDEEEMKPQILFPQCLLSNNLHGDCMIPRNNGDLEGRRKRKCVRWSTITVYEFGVAIGGSAIPRRGGPSIGLARKPKHVWSARIDEMERQQMTDKKRTAIQRHRRVRWLKPHERVDLLTKAGCSERRICRMMLESSQIAMSRRVSLDVLRSIVI